MSSATQAGHQESGSAVPAFTQLIDDAAVFPPGLAPLADAIADHRGFRAAPVAPYIGPLLVPAAGIEDVIEQIEATGEAAPDEPLRIGLVAMPGDTDTALSALNLADAHPLLKVTVIEVALSGRTPAAVMESLRPATDAGVAIALEIARRTDEVAILAQHRELIDANLLRGKYRTGGVGPGTVPPADEVATVLVSAVKHGLPLKFTAGLHHAVRTADNHGVLNMMVATVRAQQNPSNQAAVIGALLDSDAAALAATVRGWPVAQVADMRSTFTGFGCCGVLEPLAEATALRLLPASQAWLVPPPSLPPQ